MVIVGVMCLIGAFSFFGYGELVNGLVAAAAGAFLVAYGIYRNKQKQQAQAQQQTVVVNNYITKPEPEQYMKVNHIEVKDEDDLPKQ